MTRHQTEYQIRMILKRNRDGSPDRQTARYRSLMRVVRQLGKRGYGRRWDVHRLGRKEVMRLVHDWRAAGLGSRTIANYLVDLRWLAEKVGRDDQIPSNRELALGLRKNTPGWGQDKARELDHARLQKLDPRAQLVTELRREFGLRTQEAMKFQHEAATREPGVVRLADTWCKGGRPREIAITTDRQRDLLERVGQFQAAEPPSRYGHRSMIPADRRFTQYYQEYNRVRREAGLPGHALRHAWAQERFAEVAGFPAPHADGPRYRDLDAAGRSRWDAAAATVNRELGHGEGRQDITATYIGPRT